jgi:hypothetical protein
MKKILIAVFCSIVFYSCSTVEITKGVIEPKQDWTLKNEVVSTDALKNFIDANKSPKIVLRVPAPPSKVTEQEQSLIDANNLTYTEIEKNLVKTGFVVRDRALLSNLLESGNLSYEEIGKKINTDIILEIITLNYKSLVEEHKSFKNNSTKKTVKFREVKNVSTGSLNLAIAKLEGKVILVKEGQVGGLFTFYVAACPGGCTFDYNYKGDKYAAINVKPSDETQWYSAINFNFIDDASKKWAASQFAEKIIAIFK